MNATVCLVWSIAYIVLAVACFFGACSLFADALRASELTGVSPYARWWQLPAMIAAMVGCGLCVVRLLATLAEYFCG